MTDKTSIFDSYDLVGNRLASSSTATTATLFVSGTSSEPIGLDNRWGHLAISNSTAGTGNRLASATTQANTNTLFVADNANELIGTDSRWGELWITNWTSGASVVPSVNGDTFFAEIAALARQTNTLHAAIRDRAGNMGYAVKDYWVGIAGATNATQS